MKAGSALLWWVLAGVAVAALLVVPLALADETEGAEGFDGFIQSGTCADPSDVVKVDLEGEGDHDIEPYVAQGEGGESLTLGYYGAPALPGFSVAAIHTDQQFSMVITDSSSDEEVACGDILRPDADRFREAGLAVVQLAGVGSSEVQGVAVIERASLQRERDVTPANVQVILSTESVSVPAETAAGYDGYVQGGTCESPRKEVQVELQGQEDYDVAPFEATSAESGDPVTVAYLGSPLAPGFGLAAAYTDQEFSLVVTDPDSDEPVACGDILEPEADEFTEAGQALVQLQPTGAAGIPGYAVLDRLEVQRELDTTPLAVRVLLFAPPAN
jgi:flavin reductase (DIM6/NTAB) family NADH-FMN oxidoreductase RutF